MANIKYNWPALWKEFNARADKEITQEDFATIKGIGSEYLSRNFAAFRKAEREKAIDEARQALATAAPVSVGVLRAGLHSDDENLRQKAATAILDRAGLSPQAVTISVQQVNAQQAVIVPLVAGEDGEAFKKLLGGDSGEAED